ncbi:MAG: flagellar basal body-associated FliL family protein [Alphaproteobacteria bacterium]|nr:flagellar basal body-associated FliL family protein [Alphaproteobacteria bacterium]
MKKLLIFILLPLILLIGGGAGAAFMGLIPGMDGLFGGGEEEEVVEDLTVPPSYTPAPVESVTYTLPEFVLNLQTKRTYPVFLLLSLVVETRDEGARNEVAAQEPRIRDAMIVYLSSLTPAELNGYEGVERVRQRSWEILRDIVSKEALLNVQVAKMTVK